MMAYQKKIHGIYWVGFKLLLKNGSQFLFLKTSQKGLMDLPGGRADINEGKVPIKKILEREIKEELGEQVKYRLGGPVLQYRRYSSKYKIYVLITAYEAGYISGEIKLSPEHKSYQWVDPKNFRFSPKDFSSLEAYESFKDYFQDLK
jgi:hypothetical protein